MKKFILGTKPYVADLGLLILRFAAGGVMAFAHGWPKMERILAGNWKFGNPIGVGEEASLVLTVFAELACGVLVAMGLFTRAALVPLIVTMAVAVFIVHGSDPFADKEHALLFLIPYLTLFFTGPGKWSFDSAIRKA